jgi:hypothetical protein
LGISSNFGCGNSKLNFTGAICPCVFFFNMFTGQQ